MTTTPQWVKDAFIYHIFPLGLVGAPQRNDNPQTTTNRLDMLHPWVDHAASLGANTVFLGPVFQSLAHGYDTTDYFHVDSRLGDVEALRRLSQAIKDKGMRLILDGVFNHVGRDFWVFRDVQQHGAASQYADWFVNMRFDQSSPLGDPFSYESWAGNFDLVKLNLHNSAVRGHLLDAVRWWIETFDIDGIRLDAADSIDPVFFRALRAHVDGLKPDIWLMGEVVHGDYRGWIADDMLHATTNYEAYKGLYSSHNDRNYHEIAYTLNREFGSDGIYRGAWLYNFADNHDVNRVASNLGDAAHLYPLYGMLFTMPGVPSVYYGSEWGIPGRRTDHSDRMLRPTIDLTSAPRTYPHPDLADSIQQLARVRRDLPALRYGDYQQLAVDSEQMAFMRRDDTQTVVVMVNASDAPATMTLSDLPGATLNDRLNPGNSFAISSGRSQVSVPPRWLRVMVVQG